MGTLTALPSLRTPGAPVRTSDPAASGADWLPSAFRLVDFTVEHDRGTFFCAADLYHRQAALRVVWSTSVVDPEIELNALVYPDHMTWATTRDGALVVTGLSVLRQATASLNLFDTVRPERMGEPLLVERARALIDELPSPYRHLFNAIFWDHRRFARFCINPASLNNHHPDRQGLLRHTVETAEIAMTLCEPCKRAERGLVLIGALLHDAGKADEYASLGNGRWYMTDRGKLIGHGTTVLEWISAAASDLRLQEDLYMALIHVLTARQGAVAWLGIRKPAMIENELITYADRISGRNDLHNRLAAPESGWGRSHHHRYPPFTLKSPTLP